MKNLATVLPKTHIVSKLRNLYMLFAMILLSISCDENTFTTQPEAETETEVEASPADNIHVAFAGGGWRAHTAHTAWTMSLLESNGNKLDNVFKKANTISSNSGGSWFSTMLMYSPKFVTDIEKPGAIDTWANTTSDGGWLGGQQNAFDKATFLNLASCQDVSGDAFVTCVFKYYKVLTEWDRLVKKIVYQDYSLNDTLTLNSPHQKWATNKSLLLAGSMLTNNVVLNEDPNTIEDEYAYYQACLSPEEVLLNGKDGGSCNDGKNPDVTPVTFSSIPNTAMTKPLFLPAAGTGSNKRTFNVGYSYSFSGADTLQRHIQNPLKSETIPVVIAAAASSAALGFEASKNINALGTWGKTYDAEDLALNFSLAGTKVQVTGTEGKDLKYLADNKMVRIADGGAVDNSGIAQLVPFLQQNNQDTGFNIVAFDNIQVQPLLSGIINKVEAGSDIALLFGYGLCEGDKLCLSNCSETCIHVPKLQIFESSAIDTPATWSFQSKSSKYTNTPKLIYTKYKVTTTENASFGVTKGSTGTLHVFTCYYPDATTEPQNGKTQGSFKAYNDMMHFINDGLKANGNEGLTHLENAMGLK